MVSNKYVSNADVTYIILASRSLTPSEMQSIAAQYDAQHGRPSPGSTVTVNSGL